MKWLIALCVLVGSSTASGQEPIDLYYYERPPFLIRQPDGGAAGLIGSRVAGIFAKAGLVPRWQLMPAARQLHVLRAGRDPVCGVGWYRTALRESFAQFSQPIYRDRGVVILANARLDRRRYGRLADLLADRGVSILLKDGLTYGSAVASSLDAARATLTLVTVEQPQMIRMVAAGRASAMFATREEAEMLLTGGEADDESVQLLIFPDLPEVGEPRYLMCSKNVSPQTMSKLNGAIDAQSDKSLVP